MAHRTRGFHVVGRRGIAAFFGIIHSIGSYTRLIQVGDFLKEQEHKKNAHHK